MTSWTGKDNWATSGSSGSVTKRREADAKDREKYLEEQDDKEKRRKASEEAKKKEQKKKEDGTVEGIIKNIGNFTEEANKAFLDGTIETGANIFNAVGTGFNQKETDKRTKDFMKTTGLKDDKGLSKLETYKGNVVKDIGTKVSGRQVSKDSFMTEEEKKREQLFNQTDTASKWGKTTGEIEKIAADVATTVIPAAGAEKLLRGTQFASKLLQSGKAGKIAGEIGISVGSGLVATGVGTAKDPNGFTAQNAGINTGIDAAIGAAVPLFGIAFKAVRNAKNSKELDVLLKSSDDIPLGEEERKQLSKLSASGLSGKQFRNRADEIMTEAAQKKKFDVLTDGATAKNVTAKARLEDIDRRLASVDDPEYLKNNNLTRSKEAEAKYKEVLNDPVKEPEKLAATKAVTDAQAQIDYYDKIRMDSVYMRQVDSVKNKIQQIEKSRQTDLDHLKQLGDDPAIPVRPEDASSRAVDLNKEYDDMVAQQKSKLDELAAKDPEAHAESVMLDQSLEGANRAKMDADTGLDSVMARHDQDAKQAAEKLAQEPDPELLRQHKEFLQSKKELLNKRVEEAAKRYEQPNTTKAQVDEELMHLNEGTHPLVVNGASKETLYTRYKELNNERAMKSAKEVATEDPRIPKTPQEQEDIGIAALEEVANTQVGVGAKIARIWQQPANQLRAAGFDKIADMRTDAVIAFNRMAHDQKNVTKEWGKQAKGNSSKDLFKAANGEKGAYDRLNPGGRIVVEKWQAMRRELGEKMGLPKELLEQDYYIPHLFVDIRKQPKLLEVQLKMKEAQKAIDSGTLDETALKRKETHLNKLHQQVEEMVGKDNIAKYEDFIKENGDYSNRFLKKREGVEGYEENFWKATDSYQNAANTKINLEPVMQTMATAKQLTPERGMQKFFQVEIDKMRGTKADIDKGMDDWFNSFTQDLPGAKLTQNAATKSLRGFRHVLSLSHIGFSVNSAINTTAQIAIMPGSLNIDGSLYGVYKASKLVGKLSTNKLFKSDIQEFENMARMGVFEGSSHILPDATMNKYVNKFNKAAYSGITGSDRLIRMATYEGAMLKGKRMKLDGNDLERYVYERVNEVNQNFSKLEAPHAFRSQIAKSMGSLITFAPGMIIRSAEIGAKSVKAGGDIIGIGRKGVPITRAEFLKDVDDISKGVFTLMAVAGMSQVIGRVTGQDEVIPNPLKGGFYSSPALQFVFGSQYKSGFMGALTSQNGDRYDETGKNLTQADRAGQFWGEVVPSFLIPAYSQGKRTLEAVGNPFTGEKGINEKGYSETAGGEIRYKTDPANDAQRAIFGQYSTPEGKNYIDNLGHPGGASISSSKSAMIKEAPPELQNQYYDFFRSADKITGRADTSKEVTRLFKEGQPAKARRVAEEFNNKAEEKMSGFFSEYKYIDPELENELNSSIKITLTPRSEESRKKSK